MKSIFSILFCCTSLLTTLSALPGKIILSGNIIKPNNDTVIIRSGEQELFYIPLNSKGEFTDTFELKTGFYELTDGKEYTSMWLEPGFDLHISINTEQFDESITYKGKGQAENNYLASSYLFEEGLESVKSFQFYARKNEAGFLSLMDSLKTLRMNLLKKHKKGMSKAFYEMSSMIIDYDIRSNYYNYPSMHKSLTGNLSFKVSDRYPDPFKGIDLNRNEWVSVFEYTDLVGDYLHRMAGYDSSYKRGRDYYMVYIDKVDKYITAPALMIKYMTHLGRFYLGYTKSLDSVYARVMEVVKETSDREKISNIYGKLKNLEKGKPSQNFQFPDRNGTIYSLDSFKGKLIYIDVWATWCGPCLAEMPKLEALQDSLKSANIVFISICTFDDKDNWQQFLQKKKPSGVQLFADGEAEFITDYVIQGVPRFIILDKDGRIIDAEADRPSNPELLKQLRDML